MNFLGPELERYVADHTTPPHPQAVLEALAEHTRRVTDLPQMLTGPVAGRFLQMMVQLTGARRIVEVGTFTGYSALCLAAGMPDDGRLDTFEINPQYAEIAQSFWRRTPYAERIHFHLTNAVEGLADMEGPFDLAFVDADKANYPRYYHLLKPRMRPGGLMLFDNALWSGRVTAPTDPDTEGIHRLNEQVTADPDVDNVLVPIRDGIQMVRIR